MDSRSVNDHRHVVKKEKAAASKRCRCLCKGVKKSMLCEKILGRLSDFSTEGKSIEYVEIEWHEAFKKIHKKSH